MADLRIDFDDVIGKIKPMHAVNNGPLKKRADQTRHNFDTYKAAGIPFARTHDSSFCADYGGEHTVDIHMIFPDFDADPYLPSSYDFTLTDEYLLRTMSAGTEIFYRLGSKIEHEIKKYGTLPPNGFIKWAVVCEHVIRHFNEKWANGYRMGIKYFEIWNEPDLDEDDSDNKRTWGGTKAQFFDFYEVVSVHLKKCFPDLKIGGPASAGNMVWTDDFLSAMAARKAPLDFFSWHIYSSDPGAIFARAAEVRGLLDKHGFKNTESILNEWNYIKGWSDEFIDSVRTIIGMKGAAFNADVMCRCQYANVDMLMYYDARPSVFNGLFDYYTMQPLKGYYPFAMFSELYKLGHQVSCFHSDNLISAVAATDCKGSGAVMLSFFTDNDALSGNAEAEVDVNITIKGLEPAAISYTLLDRDNTAVKSYQPVSNKLGFKMKPNSVMLISLE